MSPPTELPSALGDCSSPHADSVTAAMRNKVIAFISGLVEVSLGDASRAGLCTTKLRTELGGGCEVLGMGLEAEERGVVPQLTLRT